MPANSPPLFDPLRFVDTAPAGQPEKSASREMLISRAAYFRAERRGFEPGHEEEDWLAAESEVDAELNRTKPAGKRPGGRKKSEPA